MFQGFSHFLHHFVLAKFATKTIWDKAEIGLASSHWQMKELPPVTGNFLVECLKKYLNQSSSDRQQTVSCNDPDHLAIGARLLIAWDDSKLTYF